MKNQYNKDIKSNKEQSHKDKRWAFLLVATVSGVIVMCNIAVSLIEKVL